MVISRVVVAVAVMSVGCQPAVPDAERPQGEATEPIDADGDGFVAAEDCNDQDPDIFPGAVERCDAFDRNCDGLDFEPNDCPCDSITRDDVVLSFCTDAVSWPEARDFCEQAGTQLMVDADLKLLQKASNAASEFDMRGKFWIGLSRTGADDPFTWVDGEPVGPDAWGEAEPRVEELRDCVIQGVAVDTNPVWYTNRCYFPAPFVCMSLPVDGGGQ